MNRFDTLGFWPSKGEKTLCLLAVDKLDVKLAYEKNGSLMWPWDSHISPGPDGEACIVAGGNTYLLKDCIEAKPQN